MRGEGSTRLQFHTPSAWTLLLPAHPPQRITCSSLAFTHDFACHVSNVVWGDAYQILATLDHICRSMVALTGGAVSFVVRLNCLALFTALCAACSMAPYVSLGHPACAELARSAHLNSRIQSSFILHSSEIVLGRPNEPTTGAEVGTVFRAEGSLAG